MSEIVWIITLDDENCRSVPTVRSRVPGIRQKSNKSRAEWASVQMQYPFVARRYEIYRGITTGLNEAFVIDNQTKEELVAEDPRSAEILKPLVRGRDIGRYKVDWKGLHLLATFPALGLNIDDYPAIKRHLRAFGKEKLEQSGKRLSDGTRSRKKTGNAWYEMQDTCAYHANFEKKKLLWIELVGSGRFGYDDTGLYGDTTTFLLTGECIKYLCAVLNSKLISWFLRTVRTYLRDGNITLEEGLCGRHSYPKDQRC